MRAFATCGVIGNSCWKGGGDEFEAELWGALELGFEGCGLCPWVAALNGRKRTCSGDGTMWLPLKLAAVEEGVARPEMGVVDGTDP